MAAGSYFLNVRPLPKSSTSTGVDVVSYDYPRVSKEVYVNGFEEYIRSRREEVRKGQRNPARRWVVE